MVVSDWLLKMPKVLFFEAFLKSLGNVNVSPICLQLRADSMSSFAASLMSKQRAFLANFFEERILGLLRGTNVSQLNHGWN